jgi:hypothetical protein
MIVLLKDNGDDTPLPGGCRVTLSCAGKLVPICRRPRDQPRLQCDTRMCKSIPLAGMALRADCKGCYYIAVRHLLSLLMVVILVVANGSSVAGAICRHESLANHVAARQSHDARVAGVAFSEEAAASVASKKGALADAGAVAWVADLLPGPRLTIPFGPSRPLDPDMALVRPLVGRSLAPLLEPPAA